MLDNVKESIKRKLKDNKNIMYYARCIKKRKDPFFFDDVVSEIGSMNSFRIESLGDENIDSIVYCLDMREKSGYYCIYRHILHALYVAERFGWKPYIRINGTAYNDSELEEDNVFDYFYEQPTGLTYESVSKSFSLVRYTQAHLQWVEADIGDKITTSFSGGYNITDELINVLAEIQNKYVRLKPEIAKSLDADISRVLGDEKTIGVHYRGNAYKVGLYGHPIGLEIEDYFKHVDELIQRGYKQVFLATDEQEAIEGFKKRYPGIIVCYMDALRSDNGIDVFEQSSTRKNNGRKLAYEVIRDAMTLSHCDSLVCGNSQVSYGAMINKVAQGKKYFDKRIIDKGRYKKSDLKKRIKYENNDKFITKLSKH